MPADRSGCSRYRPGAAAEGIRTAVFAVAGGIVVTLLIALGFRGNRT
jgi:hypothetical protein